MSIELQAAIAGAAVLGAVAGHGLARLARQLPRRLEYDWENQARQACDLPPLPAPRPGLWRRTAADAAAASAGGATPMRCLPFMEILSALCFALAVWRFGTGAAAVCAMVLCAGLITLAWIDAQTSLLPDVITLPLLWAGLLVNTMHVFAGPAQAILGAVLGYALLWAVFQAFRRFTGREGMGYGDFKLLAALGAWLGAPALPAVLLGASVAGLIGGVCMIVDGRFKRNQPQPFGPYLALAGIVALLAAGQPAT